MKKERIRLAAMTMLTILMITAVSVTFPMKHTSLNGKDAWVLVSRIYIHRSAGDLVLLSNGEAAYLKEGKEEDQKNVYGRILASNTEGLM